MRHNEYHRLRRSQFNCTYFISELKYLDGKWHLVYPIVCDNHEKRFISIHFNSIRVFTLHCENVPISNSSNIKQTVNRFKNTRYQN